MAQLSIDRPELIRYVLVVKISIPALACWLFPLLVVHGEPPYDPLRLDRAVEPFTQSLELQLDPEKDEYTGKTLIELQFNNATNRFRFHAKGIDLGRATLAHQEVTLKRGEADLVIGTTAQIVPTGLHRLEIAFSNRFDRTGAGLYKSVSKGVSYILSQMEPTDARRAFPCWDEPEFKHPWRVTVTIPRKLEVIGNMPIAQVTPQGEHKVVEFSRSPPLPSYLLVLAVGPFESVPVPGLSVPGRIYTAPGNSQRAQWFAAQTPRILSAFEEYIGIPYPYPKLDQMAWPEFNASGMENAGAIAYRDSVVLVDGERASYEQRRRLIGLVSHEIAHMWFGDLVTMRWWDDLWLNEAFATWLGPKVAHFLYPELRFQHGMFNRAERARAADRQPSVKAIRRDFRAGDDMNEAFDALSYQKGASILQMVEGWLGSDRFRVALRHYFGRHLWGNAAAEDLWRAFEETGAGNMGEVLRRYVEQPGLPELAFKRLPGDRCEVTQRRYRALTAPHLSPQLWHVPVVGRYGAGEKVRTFRFLLTREQEVFQAPGLDQAEWFHPNVEETGYYVWTLEPELSAALTNRAVLDRLSPVERLGLLDGALSALQSGRMTPVQRIQLMLSLAEDPEPEIKARVVNGLEGLAEEYLEEVDRPVLAAFLHRHLRPMLDELGLEPAQDELPQLGPLRADLLRVLGSQGHEPDLVAYCRHQASRLLENPLSVDAGLAQAVLEVAAWHGNEEWLARLRGAFEQASQPDARQRFLYSLGGFSDPALVQRVLDATLTPAMNASEFMLPILRSSGRPENAAVVFDWVRRRYEDLKHKAPEDRMDALPGLLSAADALLLAQGRAFFLNPSRKTPLIEVRLTKVTEEVKLRLALRKNYQESVRRLIQEEMSKERLP